MLAKPNKLRFRDWTSMLKPALEIPIERLPVRLKPNRYTPRLVMETRKPGEMLG